MQGMSASGTGDVRESHVTLKPRCNTPLLDN
jgi:hypothetical protein